MREPLFFSFQFVIHNFFTEKTQNILHKMLDNSSLSGILKIDKTLGEQILENKKMLCVFTF